MSITLNHSDFQSLQDQLVDLRTKNYELAEKNRRGQADFEAAKAKICALQMQLEEQEQDFQVTSTTLRREIEVAYSNSSSSNNNNKASNNDSVIENNDTSDSSKDEDGDYKTKYKKVLHKAREIQQRYEKSVEVVQQMDSQIKSLNGKVGKLEEQNSKLKEELLEKQKQLDVIEEENSNKLNKAMEEYRNNSLSECVEHLKNLDELTKKHDNLLEELSQVKVDLEDKNAKLESQIEERKINDRKGTQIVRELKRQLALEKNRCETLQNRIETLLEEQQQQQAAASLPTTATISVSNNDLENKSSHLSTSSSTNGNSSSTNGNTLDGHSVSSWSLVPGKTPKSSLSICSIDSEDRSTVQQLCDNKSECSLQPLSSTSNGASRQDLSVSVSLSSPAKTGGDFLQTSKDYYESLKHETNSQKNMFYSTESGQQQQQVGCGMLIEEQAALMERLTSMQHDKWALEEKLSYLEHANVALAEDLANKSDIIKHYFMDQALKSATNTIHQNDFSAFGSSSSQSSRRVSLTSAFSQFPTDKPSIKKVVDFLKERSQISSLENESVSREAIKKMQVMLEETLIKCLKLQENLDSVTAELTRLRRSKHSPLYHNTFTTLPRPSSDCNRSTTSKIGQMKISQ